MSKPRNSNFELMRIVLMVMIMLHHSALHTSWNIRDLPFFTREIMESFLTFGHAAVGGFFMVSGYFLSRKKANHYRVKKLYYTVLGYSVVGFLLGYFFIGNHSVLLILKSFLPFLLGNYWFATTYILVLLLLNPINHLINYIFENYSLMKQLIVLFVICVITIYPTTRIMGSVAWSFNLGKNGIIDALMYYYLGALIENYRDFFTHLLIRRYKILFLLTPFILNIIAIFLVEKISFRFQAFFTGRLPMHLLLAVGIFIFFLNIDIGSRKAINSIASCVFAVYLIHDNEYFRDVLWNQIVDLQSSINSSILFIKLGFSIVFIFFISISLEMMRKRIAYIFSIITKK